LHLRESRSHHPIDTVSTGLGLPSLHLESFQPFRARHRRVIYQFRMSVHEARRA
jgi:hypothetical protein